MGRRWKKLRRFVAQKVLHADDTPHAIALGCAVAVFVAILPLIGLQTLLAIGLAALLRANKAICVPVVWITNPFTMVPIYGTCYALGRSVLRHSRPQSAVDLFAKLEIAPDRSFFDPAFWKAVFERLVSVGAELWIGSMILGVVLGIVSYFLARWGVSAYRERRRQRILRCNLVRATRQRTGAVQPADLP